MPAVGEVGHDGGEQVVGRVHLGVQEIIEEPAGVLHGPVDEVELIIHEDEQYLDK